MTVLRKPIKRELAERIGRRVMIVELHPGLIRFREKGARHALELSWEGAYWKAAEIAARHRDAERARNWRRPKRA